GSEQFEQLLEFRARGGGAIKDLIRGIVFDFRLTGAARPILLDDKGVQVPDAVDQFRNPAWAAQVGRESVLRGSRYPMVKKIAQPGPFEIGRTHRLGLVTRQE